MFINFYGNVTNNGKKKMTIPNVIVLAQIAKWIVDYSKQNCKSNLIIPFTGTINDIVLIKICLESKNLCGLLNIHCLIEKTYKNVYDNLFGNLNIKHELFDNTTYNDLAMLYLKSHYLANELNGIVLGNVDKTTGCQCRIYNKLAEYTADIFPIYDIKYSQLYSIAKENFANLENVKPLSCEYEMLEWCIDADKLYGIITSEDVPNKNTRWPFFMQNQKTVIARINRIEKSTRHKQINKPYFKSND
jgi:hypothetical protein